MHAHSLLVLLTMTGGVLAQAPFKVVNSFPNPHGASYANGLAYARGELWLNSGLSANPIHRVNAYTGAPLGTIPAPTASLRGMTHDGVFLWATSWSNNTVYQMIDVTGAVVGSFPAFVGTGKPDGMAWDGALLVIGDESNGIHWFTTTGSLVRSITVPASGSSNPRDLGWDGTGVWAGYQSSGRIRKHDPLTGAVLVDFAAPSGNFQQGLEWADGYLWATGGFNAMVYQIDVGPPYLELVGTFSTGTPVSFKLTEAQSQTGDLAIVLLSLTGVSPTPIGGVNLLLSFDALTQLSLQALPLFSARVDAQGVAQTPTFNVPPLALGVQFYAAALTLRTLSISGVADPIRFVSQ